MGFGGISPWSLLLILLIVVLIFGTKRLKGVGGDLGAAIKSFKQSMSDGEQEETRQLKEETTKVVEGKVKEKEQA